MNCVSPPQTPRGPDGPAAPAVKAPHGLAGFDRGTD